MQIAVLGDYRLSLAFRKCVNKYNVKTKSKHTVKYFTTSDNFKNRVRKKCEYDMVIVALDNNTIDPDELLKFIRKEMCNYDIYIILASKNEYGSLKLIKYHLLDFLTLPLDYKSVYDCIEFCELGRENKFFIYNISKVKHKIPVSKIIYLENFDRKVVIHTKDDDIIFYGKLSDCRKQESLKNFIDIHQSYYVNPMYVESIDSKSLILTDNKKLPISRHKLQNVMDLILQ